MKKSVTRIPATMVTAETMVFLKIVASPAASARYFVAKTIKTAPIIAVKGPITGRKARKRSREPMLPKILPLNRKANPKPIS